jgi:hypothetical protein
VPATSATPSQAFFAAAINSTNETNKAGSLRHLISLSFIDVYGEMHQGFSGQGGFIGE